MATSASTLVQRTRRFISDWPATDSLTASVTSSATTITVADGTLYSKGWLLQADSEALYVTANGAGSSVSVLRGRRGTTGASHASGVDVLLRPHFLDIEILDALNSGINASFPLLYQPVNDTSITTSPTVYEYSVPSLNGQPIPYLSRISFLEASDLAYRNLRDWEVIRATTPLIKFRRYLPAGTLRVQGFGPLPPMTDLSSSLSALFPLNAEDALTYYAAQYLLASGEARRVREDTGARDDRESANRVGASLQASQSMLQRYMMRLQQAAMPPMPKNIKAVF